MLPLLCVFFLCFIITIVVHLYDPKNCYLCWCFLLDKNCCGWEFVWSFFFGFVLEFVLTSFVICAHCYHQEFFVSRDVLTHDFAHSKLLSGGFFWYVFLWFLLCWRYLKHLLALAFFTEFFGFLWFCAGVMWAWSFGTCILLLGSRVSLFPERRVKNHWNLYDGKLHFTPEKWRKCIRKPLVCMTRRRATKYIIPHSGKELRYIIWRIFWWVFFDRRILAVWTIWDVLLNKLSVL